jgi:hypothetical protein
MRRWKENAQIANESTSGMKIWPRQHAEFEKKKCWQSSHTRKKLYSTDVLSSIISSIILCCYSASYISFSLLFSWVFLRNMIKIVSVCVCVRAGTKRNMTTSFIRPSKHFCFWNWNFCIFAEAIPLKCYVILALCNTDKFLQEICFVVCYDSCLYSDEPIL